MSKQKYKPKHAKSGLDLSSGSIYALIFLGVWAFYALMTNFVAQPFSIPSESMVSTLNVSDRLIVNKTVDTYHRGDVVVFTDPGGWNGPDHANVITDAARHVSSWAMFQSYHPHIVKRIIGLPGDHVTCSADKGGSVVVNNVPISEPYLNKGVAPCDVPFSITVPKGKVWVMGDNRDRSFDSRGHDDGTGRTGSVPMSDITGRVGSIVWPYSHWGQKVNDEDAFHLVK